VQQLAKTKTMERFSKLWLILIFLVTGCYYDNEEVLYAEVNNSCNLENITYSATVKPILQASCYSCHSNANANGKGAGLKLENYSDLQIQVKNGRLMGAVKHDKGFSAMPDGGGKLTDCQINQLQKWIDTGALNN
jgi:cytochrome c5